MNPIKEVLRVGSAILFLNLLLALLAASICSWWWAMFHDWTAEVWLPIRFDRWNEQWIEGALLHLALIYFPFVYWWVLKRLARG